MSTVTIPQLDNKATPELTDLFEISENPGSFHSSIGSLSALYQLITEKNSANGYAGLDGSGLLSVSQIPTLIPAINIADGTVNNTEFQFLNGITSNIQTQLDATEKTANKGAVSGYAGLDASQLLLLANFPTGSASQVLARNSGNTALEFTDILDGKTVSNFTYLQSDASDAQITNAINLGNTQRLAWRNGTDDGNASIRLNANDVFIFELPNGANFSFRDTDLNLGDKDIRNAIDVMLDSDTAHELQFRRTTGGQSIPYQVGRADWMYPIDGGGTGTSRFQNIIIDDTAAAEEAQFAFSVLSGGSSLQAILTLDKVSGINVHTNKIINVVDPTVAQDAATKNYVDNQVTGLLPVADTTSIVEGNADPTKLLRFDVSSNTTGITGVIATAFTTAKTITFPDATDTLVGLATTDTLTNKTLTTPIITSFTNATHDHEDAAGGGTLLSTTALSDTANIAYLNTANTFGAFLQSFTTSSMRIPLSAAPTMAADGDFAIDTTVTDFSHGIIKYYDGEELGVVSMPIAQFTSPVGGDVIAYNATNNEFELVTISTGEFFGPWTANHDAGGFNLDNLVGIRDDNSDELLTFTSDTTPVNFITIGSADTGVGPTIGAQGSDTNINLNIDSKGTGTVNISSNFSFTGTSQTEIDMGGSKITDVATPAAATDAANKEYVDGLTSGLVWKDPARLASTADIDLSTGGLLTIDDVTTVAADRVVVKNQTNTAENGIYEADSSTWIRTTDADTAAELNLATIFVEEGTLNAGKAYTQTQTVVTIDTDPVLFVEIFSTTPVIAGDGLSFSGNNLNVGAGTGITVNADTVQISAGYVGQTSITTLGTITTGTWNGTDIAVADGGTGVGTFASGGVLYGNGTTNILATTAPSSGQILVGNTTVPAFVTMSGDATIDNTGALTAQPAIVTGQTVKGVPIAADELLISDSADSNNLKKVTIGTLPFEFAFSNTYSTDPVSTNDYWALSGGPTGNSFLNRECVMPNNMTMKRLTVRVSSAPNATTTFVLALSAVSNGNNTITVEDTETGSFTDVSNTDVVLSGAPLAYHVVGDGNGSTISSIGIMAVITN